MTAQLAFDFGTAHIAANDPAYSTELFKSSRRDRDYYRTLTAKRQRLLIFERDRWQCQACGALHSKVCKLKIDHIIPIAAGGDEYCLANQRALCQQCHNLKTSMDAIKYGWRVPKFG